MDGNGRLSIPSNFEKLWMSEGEFIDSHYLRSLTPTNWELIENKKVRISLDKHKLNAYPLEGDDWEDSLAKELVLDKDVKASHAEIAACCLWHTSFWGYLPYQREESFRKITTDNLKLI